MVKPKFILSTGTGWSATSPLWYTLQLDNQYIHTGLKKDGGYLDVLSMTREERFHSNLKRIKIQGRSRTDEDRDWAREVLEMNREILKELETNPNAITRGDTEHAGVLAGVRKDCYFTQEEVDQFISPSINNYVNYYKTHWRHLQDHGCPYMGVGDFSNTNADLPDFFCQGIVEKLSEFFDVKVLMIVRDPIRRLWSEVNSFWGPRAKRHWNSQKECTQYFVDKVKKQDYWNYVEIIKKWERVCPTHVIIMEQLWEGSKKERERKKLSDFLDYDIKKIHENVYCPDRGPHAPHYLGLYDQWRSDKYWLQDELYNKVRPLFPVYQQWVDKYGSLPLYWGKPYNYEV